MPMNIAEELKAKNPILDFAKEYERVKEYLLWGIAHLIKIFTRGKLDLTEEQVEKAIIFLRKNPDVYAHDHVELPPNPAALLPQPHSA
jgi:hypothetical protein